MTQVEQVMLPKASIASGPEAETATVPEAFGKVMVREAVGSVMAKVVLLASTVAPSKTSGEAPERVAPVRFTVPVVVKPVKPEATPPEVTPQELELIATEAEPLPSVVTPVEDRVVKEPGPPLTAQVEQPMAPAAERVIGPTAETATVPEAFGRVMVLLVVGSVTAIVVLLASAVTPSKTSGEAPVMFPEESAMLPFAVKVWATVKAPLSVVVMPVRPSATDVALVFPRLRAAAESTVRAPADVLQVAAAAEVRVKAPEVVLQVEAAPPVKVRAAPEVNCEAEVGVKLTAPAPVALKFPEVRLKAIGVELAVVIVAPAL